MSADLCKMQAAVLVHNRTDASSVILKRRILSSRILC